MRPLGSLLKVVESVFQPGVRTDRARRREAAKESAFLVDVPPKETDPRLTGWFDAHLAAIPRKPAESPFLWVFLGGSFGRPQGQVSILHHMASLGHWAINLRYPNDWTIAGLSRHSAGDDVSENLRLQILDGRARSGMLDFPPQDCILNRLQKLLVWLAANQPAQGWSAFLNDSDPNWSRIAVAGHSQGGGHAALMGKEIPLARVVMLAAPADSEDARGKPAPWLSRPGITPPDRYFGFTHVRDAAIDHILAGWQALELAQFGDVVRVEDNKPPFGSSHQLTTALDVPGGRPHNSMAGDRFIPRAYDHTPLFQDAWTYLFQLS